MRISPLGRTPLNLVSSKDVWSLLLAARCVAAGSRGAVCLTSATHHPTAQICSSPESLGVGRRGWSGRLGMLAQAAGSDGEQTSLSPVLPARCFPHPGTDRGRAEAVGGCGRGEILGRAPGTRWGLGLPAMGDGGESGPGQDRWKEPG